MQRTASARATSEERSGAEQGNRQPTPACEAEAGHAAARRTTTASGEAAPLLRRSHGRLAPA
eukprot:397916-Alexandrium_andersonii.AAC.1